VVAIDDVPVATRTGDSFSPASTFCKSLSTPGSDSGSGSRRVARRMSLARRVMTWSFSSLSDSSRARLSPKRIVVLGHLLPPLQILHGTGIGIGHASSLLPSSDAPLGDHSVTDKPDQE
jgi:hypothetical protein